MVDINEIPAGTIIRTKDGNRARVLRPSEDGAFLAVEYLHDGSGDLCGADEIASVVVVDDRARDVLEEVIEKMDEIAALLRSLGNERIDAYCLAAFEGKVLPRSPPARSRRARPRCSRRTRRYPGAAHGPARRARPS
jgi:hypothetical protein